MKTSQLRGCQKSQKIHCFVIPLLKKEPVCSKVLYLGIFEESGTSLLSRHSFLFYIALSKKLEVYPSLVILISSHFLSSQSAASRL